MTAPRETLSPLTADINSWLETNGGAKTVRHGQVSVPHAQWQKAKELLEKAKEEMA